MQKAVEVDGIQAGVMVTLRLKSGWKPEICTNRTYGEGEVAVSTIILFVLPLDSQHSSVFLSKPNNM